MKTENDIAELRAFVETLCDQMYQREWPKIKPVKDQYSNVNSKYSLKQKKKTDCQNKETGSDKRPETETAENVESVEGNELMTRGQEEGVASATSEDGKQEHREAGNGRDSESQREDKDQYPWQEVRRRKGKDRKRRPIIVCGDSMIRGMENNIRMEEKESKWCCLPGAKVQEIMVDVKDKCKNRAEDFVVIQGGGNGLVDTGYEETAKSRD